MPDATGEPPLLQVDGLCKHYPLPGRGLRGSQATVRAVDGISFTLARGRTLGLVGESGCGKSTAGKAILRLLEPSSGRVVLDGVDVTALPPRALHSERRNMQVIFQDPYASLNPRMTAAAIVTEPMANYGLLTRHGRAERVAELFDRVGLRADQMGRYPSQFSGGQRQRLGIARALALSPKLVVGDEPVSALDVSVQAQVINLMVRLQADLGLSYVFIAHDLAVVRHISDQVAVMYLGRIVEMADVATVFSAPAHPYTRLLLASVPSIAARGTRFTPMRGEPPSAAAPPPGCHFHPRCPQAVERCRVEVPHLREVSSGQVAACHLA